MSTDPEITWAVLGTNSIYPKEDLEQENRNRVVVPENVVKLDIANLKRPLNWGRDMEESKVMISRKTDGFDDSNTEYRYADNVTLQDNRVATIPLQFLETEEGEPDYTGRTSIDTPLDQEFRFQYGESVHFVTGPSLIRSHMCYTLKDKEARAMIDESLHDILTDGGWNIIEEKEVEPSLYEAYLSEGEVLLLPSGDVVSVEELRERWEEEISEYTPDSKDREEPDE